MTSRHAAVRTSLTPMEYASIAIFGGLAVAAVVIGSVIPLATAVRVLAPVPLALIAARTRPRAMVAAGVTTTAVTFALAGTGAAASVFASALAGGIVGEIKRRGHGFAVLALVTLLVAPLIGGATVVLLLVLAPLRHLVLTVMTNSIGGVAKQLHHIGALSGTADWIDGLRPNLQSWWWAWLWVSGAVGTVLTMLIAWWVLGRVIARLADVPSEDTLDAADRGSTAAVAPLPTVLRGVGFTYHRGEREVLHDVDLDVQAGEFVAVVGANGSGKSTLAKVLAGRPPTTGVVDRPGAAGLGLRGGTAMVLQRPETQMLGARVADDVVWGLPPDTDVDVDALLGEVGLGGLGVRETSDLSGGQQQRLAIAAALARDPALLIADEVTSMVDPDGREAICGLLAGLPERRDMAVVLVTHRATEAVSADRVIHLVDGRVMPHPPSWLPTPEDLAAPTPIPRFSDAATPADRAPLLTMDDVGHVYLQGSPWEVRALHDVTLTVGRGDGVLVVGGNGSGKTTLAWIMAGLITPTRGQCLLGGKPVTGRVGDVGLAFQHARLQLQKQTVGEEIMAVGGEKVGSGEVAHVLESVGLPREMAATRVDALSGGQMRRVVLAGLIARRPEVLVLDEPLAGLDPFARDDVIALLARLRRDGMTIVIISHDFESLDQVCDRRVYLTSGMLVPPGDAAGPSAPPAPTGPDLAGPPPNVPHGGGE